MLYFSSNGSNQIPSSTTPPLRYDEAGGIRIGSTRVTLDRILASYQNGSTAEEIAIQFSA